MAANEQAATPSIKNDAANNKHSTSLWAVAGVGAIGGMFIGCVVGWILDSHYANYKDVLCSVSGHENGGTHGKGEDEWHHHGPTYETYASVGDEFWFLGSMITGIVIGTLIGIAIEMYLRNNAATQSVLSFSSNTNSNTQVQHNKSNPCISQ